MARTIHPNMGQRSLLETVERYPVTFGACALAIAATATWHTGGDVGAYVLDERIWEGEVWRVITCVFPHVSFIHLLFNLYWTWRFGLFVEEFHRWKGTLGFFLFFAAASSLVSFTAGENGVGLSGVGYGLFGMLWIMSRRDSRLRGAIDAGTAYIFIAWFFLCILLTWTGVMRIGNVAHGAGWAAGVAAGYAFSDLVRGWRRKAARASLAALLAISAVGALLRAPFVDAFGSYNDFLAVQAHQAILARDDRRAARRLEELAGRTGGHPYALVKLGAAYARLGRERDALAAFRKAVGNVNSPGSLIKYVEPGEAFLALKTAGLAEEKEGDEARAIELLEAAYMARRIAARETLPSPGPAADLEVEEALARLHAKRAEEKPGDAPPAGD